MRYLLIPDKFKGSATAAEVVAALKQGIKSSDPQAQIDSIAASDGGDGFLDFIAEFNSITRIEDDTQNALQQPIRAAYGYDSQTKTAYIELAQASGLAGIAHLPTNILATSTYGTGMQIKQALALGAQTIVLGLGGSGTNDAGLGIAHALGYTFLDENQEEIIPISGNLHRIQKSIPPEDQGLKAIKFIIVNDVKNPLIGPQGAVATYAPQKGARPKEMKLLEKGLQGMTQVLQSTENPVETTTPGTGAAGGTAYGMVQLFNAKMIFGADFLLLHTPLSTWLSKENYDYIITGEGAYDTQSLQGKLVGTVCSLAKIHDIPVLIICGSTPPEQRQNTPAIVKAILPLKSATRSATYCMQNASPLITSEIAVFLKQLNTN